jgi:glycosyltransferase involved in cell wall biosynthesis
MYAKNLLRQMASDPDLDVKMFVIKPEAHREGTARYFERCGIEHIFGAIHPPSLSPAPTLREALRLAYRVMFQMPYELQAWNQPHLGAMGDWAIRHWAIEHVVVDYLYAVLFWPGLRTYPIPKTIVTCNREAEMYADRLALGLTGHGRTTGWVSHRRLRRFERRVYKAFSRVVVIGRPDTPPYLPPSRTACITPYLEPRPERWRPGPGREVFFVGAIGHYPNRQAMEYIAARLAPAVARLVPDATFTILGASEADVPAEWRHPAVCFLGNGDAEETRRRFLSCRLFVCPVRNTYGMKFKVAEALSYGTPFLASPETMLCVPYLAGQPVLPLDDAERAAAEVAQLLTSDDRLAELAATIESRHLAFLAEQDGVWSRALLAAA